MLRRMFLKLILASSTLSSTSGFVSNGMAMGTSAKALRLKNDLNNKIQMGYDSGLLEHLHCLLISHNGQTATELYFEGHDQNWGRDLGHVKFDPETLHDLRSVSKSVVSILYSIALSENKVPPLDAKLLDAFPQYADLLDDPKRAAWTVGHVINMTIGTEWNEDLPYTDPRNSEIMMENADDRYRFILDRPIVSEAGSRWIYNGGCSAILGYLIAEGSGQSLAEFAEDKLFKPLGIKNYGWNSGSDGVPSAASGLRLTAPDLAKIGELLLGNGKFGNNQIVPKHWVEDYFNPKIDIGFGQSYSNQFYLGEFYLAADDKMHQIISARGLGGQRLFVSPSLDLVVVMFTGAYNRNPDQWILPSLVLEKLVLSNLELV